MQKNLNFNINYFMEYFFSGTKMMVLIMAHNSVNNCASKLMFFHVMEQYPTTHRFTALSICFCVIEFARIYIILLGGYWVQRRVFHIFSLINIYFQKPDPKALANFPLLVFSIICSLFVFFSHETRGQDLPDLEREALSKKLEMP